MKELLQRIINDQLAVSAIGCWLILSILLIALVLHLITLRGRKNRHESRIIKLGALLQDTLTKLKKGEIPDAEIIKMFGGKNTAVLRECVEDLCFEKSDYIDELRRISNITGLTRKMRAEALSRDKWIRTLAVRCLAALGNPEDIPLLKAVVDKDNFKPAILAASTGLAACKEESVIADIIERLFDKNRPNRDMLLSALTMMGQNRAEQIVGVLTSSSLHDDVISTLADVLGVWHYRPARPVLENILEQTQNPEVRLHVIEALEKTGDASTCAKIMPHLKDADFRVRLKAVNALERLAGDAHMDRAADLLLNDPDKWVKRNAAEAMSRMGAKGMAKLESYKSNNINSVRYVVKLVLAEKKFGRMRWRFRYAESIP